MQRDGPDPVDGLRRAGLYVHIPFCIKKCRYCSFNSIPYEKNTAGRYLGALVKEVKSCRAEVEPGSIYIGGGTPTVLSQEGVIHLLAALRERFGTTEATEATIEANPGTLDGLDLSMYKRVGINRVSLGAQSFNPAELKMLGRLHGPEEVRASVRRLRAAGFENIGMDLMYCLPGQDLASWKESLTDALSLEPAHISIYDLTLETDVPLYLEVKAGRLVMPPETVQVEMYTLALEVLDKAGLVRYEISNFARPGSECRHNLNYWSCGDYLGLGAGAHSHVSGTRYENISDVEGYVAAVGRGGPTVSSSEALSPSEMEREYIMLSLRKAGGIPTDEFKRRHGHGFMETYGEKAAGLERAGYLKVGRGSVLLTVKGILAANAVIREFF